MLQNIFDIHEDKEVHDFIRENVEDWDCAMASTKMTKEHYGFGGDFDILLMRMIYKMHISVHTNVSKSLILRTDIDNLFCFLGFGHPPARVHPPCNLYLLSYYCPTNPPCTNIFNHYMYLAVEGRKSANTFVGCVLSDEWNPYHFVKESGTTKHPTALLPFLFNQSYFNC